MKKLIFLLLLSQSTLAQTIYLPNIKGTATGTQDGSHNALDVTLVGGAVIGAVNQGTKGTVDQSWYVQPCDGTNCQTFNADGSANISILGSLPAGTNNIGNTGRTWTLDSGTDSISAAQNGTWSVGRTWSLASPGDSVSAVQSGPWTTDRSWALDSTTDSVTIQGGNSTAVKVDGSAVVQPISGTVTVSPQINTNGSFTQAAISGAASISAPANAIGFIIMADDANTANLNYEIGGTASSTDGMQLEPGRDSGPIMIATAVSVCPTSGTQTYRIQWILTN